MTNDRKRPGQATRAFNRFARRVAGRRAMPVWALVHHVGRVSGQAYTTPVAVLASPDAFYVALPWGRDTDWVRNLRAAGGGTIMWKGRTYDVSEPTFVERAEVLSIADPFRRQALKRWALTDFLRVRRIPAGRR
jgi:deazaflavin-dependent oxidoreductase (nitroreductase family)